MAYSVKILKDSIAPSRIRLTTFELTYPRFVHSELMTHRVFSRNSASSRAIPTEKLIQRVLDDPAMPVYWGKNQSGMQAAQELSHKEKIKAKEIWLSARNEAIKRCRRMLDLGVHKQIANRIIEPWMWITVIVSATEFGNWFNLRCHKDAQPELNHFAEMMYDEYCINEPTFVTYGNCHLPLTGFPGDEYLSGEELRKVSVGRCARVSYLTHNNQRDVKADIELHDRLLTSGHWSPFEHVARAECFTIYSGNFCGWTQYRQTFKTQNQPVFTPSPERLERVEAERARRQKQGE